MRGNAIQKIADIFSYERLLDAFCRGYRLIDRERLINASFPAPTGHGIVG